MEDIHLTTYKKFFGCWMILNSLTDTMSLADVSVGVFLYRLDEIDLEITFPEHVGAWYGRLKNCEGFQRWAMSDFSSLKGRLQY